MNTTRQICRKIALGIVVAACLVSISGCEGDYEVPITSGPTHRIDERLLGNWVSKDGKDKMKVRRLNDSIAIVSCDGDLFRAFHSDVAKTSFISVQDIDSAHGKYIYLTYKLSDDAEQLSLRVVNSKVVPKETKDSASVQRLLTNNLQNPELFKDQAQFVREK